MTETIRALRGSYFNLSNFSLHPVEYDGMFFWTAEAAFQAAKSLNYDDRLLLASVRDPASAKILGRKLPLRNGWDEGVRVVVMREILLSKFHLNGGCRSLLRSTGGAAIVEGNRWHDNVWGDCDCGRLSCQEPGLNLLGQLLMEIRDTWPRDLT